MKNPGVLLLVALFLAGCQNAFRNSYQATPIGPDVTLAPYSGTTQVSFSSNLTADFMKLVDDWYVPIGRSSFQLRATVPRAQFLTQAQVKGQGQAVGADIVLWANPVSGYEQTVRPNPVSRDPGESRRDYNPMVDVTLSIFDYGAIYFRKATSCVCGLSYNDTYIDSHFDLPASSRKKLPRNSAAVVTHVIPRTPAAMADIRVGDVIVKVNDSEIDSFAALFNVINMTQGQTDTFTLIRYGELKTITVTLNAH